MKAPILAAAILAMTAVPLRAQDTTLAVRPGMTEAEAIARWGEPMAVRRAGDWTYLFYRNGFEHERRYSDVIFLQGGQVVDAIVRAPGRLYLGQSSSPPGRLPEFTPPRTEPQRPEGQPGTVTGVRVSPTME